MGIKYAELRIAIHGIDATPDALTFLVGWLKAATRAGLAGHQRELFKYRDAYDSDIEVEVVETAENDSSTSTQPNAGNNLREPGTGERQLD